MQNMRRQRKKIKFVKGASMTVLVPFLNLLSSFPTSLVLETQALLSKEPEVQMFCVLKLYHILQVHFLTSMNHISDLHLG